MNNSLQLIDTLKAGNIAVIPTDTLFGIVAVAADEAAVERLYKARRRNPSKPCIILISDVKQLKDLGITPSADQLEIINQYWPGPASLIFHTNVTGLEYLHRGTGTLALRLPNSDDLRSLIDQTGPLIAPSANHEGLPPATTIEEVKRYFGDEMLVYIDNGKCLGKPSGVIDLTGVEPTIIRPLPQK